MIEEFLKSVDKHLTKDFELIIIGGAAASLAYKVKMVTQDIDTIHSIKGLESAYEKAKKETKLDILLSETGVWDAPSDFEARLIEVDGSYKRLTVKVPEIHDLILMKIIRGYEHDLEAIEEMAKKNKVSQDILVERFMEEMGAVVGDRRNLELNFLGMIDRLFGEVAAAAVEKKYFS